MMIPHQNLVTWFFGVIVCFASGEAHAGIETAVTCGAGNSTLYGTTYCNNPSLNAHSSAEAEVNYGVMKTAANTTAWGGAGGATAVVHARFYDTFTIYAPGLEGKVYSASATPFFSVNSTTVTGRYGIATNSSIVSMSINNESAVRTHILSISFDDAGSVTNEFLYAQDNGVDKSFDDPMVVNWSYVYGRQVSLLVDIKLTTSSKLDATAIADAMHSFYWGGIEVAGLTHDQFYVRSASGTDWEQSFVPAVQELSEPSMFYLGFAMLLFMLRASLFAKIVTKFSAAKCP